MNKTRVVRQPVFLAAIAMVCLVALSCGKGPKQQGEFRIGVMFPLTGDAASYGEKGKNAVDFAMDEVNGSGGIRGGKVRVFYEDSKADPATGVSAVQKLISVDGVKVVIGDIVSSTTLAVAPIVERNRVLLLVPTASAPAITNAGQYIYRIWPSDLVEGQAIAEFALKRGLKRVAILHMKNDYGTAIAGIFKKALEAGNGAVVFMDGYTPDVSDYRSVLTKVDAAKPDAIYVAGYFADSATILRQARELGVKGQFLGTTAIEDNKFLELAGNAAEGLLYPVATGFDPSSDSPKVRKFVQAFEARYKYQPGWVEAQCYEAFMLVYHAAGSITGNLDGTAMKRRFDSMGVYDGITGSFQFDKNGDVMKPVVFKTVRDGKFITINE